MGTATDGRGFRTLWHADRYHRFRTAIFTHRAGMDMWNCTEGTQVWADGPSLQPTGAGSAQGVVALGIGLAAVAWMVRRALAQQEGGKTRRHALPGWPVSLAFWSFVLLQTPGRAAVEVAGQRSPDVETGHRDHGALGVFQPSPRHCRGGAVATWGIHRQGLSAGRSTALVFHCLMDELFYVIAVPLLVLLLGEAVRPESTERIRVGLSW